MKESYNNFKKLTDLLSDCQFHDGDSLGEQVGVSRTAIWKMTKKLLDYGVAITSVKGKGYILAEPLILLDEKTIRKSLDSTLAKKADLIILESTQSTNLYLRHAASQMPTTICIAEHQSAGVGRLARSWITPFGKNVALSYRTVLQCDIADLSGLSLAISIAILKTLQKFDLQPQVKWPNDIYCSDKKMAGCLIELIAESNGNCTVIIGVGINVNMIETSDKITQSWTSMRQETGQCYDRNAIAAELITEINAALQNFIAEGLAYFKDTYQQFNYLTNREVTILQHQAKHEGTVIGIDDFGRLLLKTSAKLIIPISVGDATIKK